MIAFLTLIAITIISYYISRLIEVNIYGVYDGDTPWIYGVVVFFIALMTMLAVEPDTKLVKTNTTYLESFQDNVEMNANLFLGTGKVKDELVYRYYYKSDQGFRAGSIPVSGTLIKYTDSNPRIEIAKLKRVNGEWIDRFIFCRTCCKPKYTVFIPKGSIQTNFNLDAQ